MHRRNGIATILLQHVLSEARRADYRRLSLETGSMEFFAPARVLYERHGFEYCPPFGDYQPDPNSVFMRLDL
jgi:putative acetyltransferase